VPRVEVKVVDGQMRLKAPSMFSRLVIDLAPNDCRLTYTIRYLSHDSNLTENSFDEHGYFITGDCAEKLGDSYKLHGRANIDG
jgi:malonyl-CoA/methylmalonyl-CoA synthetase